MSGTVGWYYKIFVVVRTYWQKIQHKNSKCSTGTGLTVFNALLEHDLDTIGPVAGQYDSLTSIDTTCRHVGVEKSWTGSSHSIHNQSGNEYGMPCSMNTSFTAIPFVDGCVKVRVLASDGSVR